MNVDEVLGALATVNNVLANRSDAPTEDQSGLFADEKSWALRHDFLFSKGYQLRARYCPGWKASWKTSPSEKNEDAIPLSIVGGIMDAQRSSDGSVVMMKILQKNSAELQITSRFSSKEMRDDPDNHCVPLLDVLDDPLDSQKCIMVLPLLRDSREPRFASIGDCIDFVEQTLKGILFLHNHKVAHRDCFVENILMDARALYPKGWHPQDANRTRSGRYMPDNHSPRRSRVGGVRYYFIDFGISSDAQDEVTGNRGQLIAPELSDITPYDPYKVDIWLLGQSYNHMITSKFRGVDWIKSFIEAMTRDSPADRPTIQECVRMFTSIKAQLDRLALIRRLHPLKPEWKPTELIRDATFLLAEGFWRVGPRHKPLKPFEPNPKSISRTEDEEISATGIGQFEVTTGSHSIEPLGSPKAASDVETAKNA
ncbi:hypothetical protein FRC02_002768 [Tulasnella sp. 418]|nr:hypothetical protein FRC02_002768 [Tulasnella sp. 418]